VRATTKRVGCARIERDGGGHGDERKESSSHGPQCSAPLLLFQPSRVERVAPPGLGTSPQPSALRLLGRGLGCFSLRGLFAKAPSPPGVNPVGFTPKTLASGEASPKTRASVPVALVLGLGSTIAESRKTSEGPPSHSSVA
jgi:hypothetical protein